MVVKSKIGRKRYIIFKIESDSDFSRYDLIYTFKRFVKVQTKISAGGNDNTNLSKPKTDSGKKSLDIQNQNNDQSEFIQMPWVITIDNNCGLIRCHHLEKDKTIDLLNSIRWLGKSKNPVKIKTLGTTGTIRSARKKYLEKLNLYPLNGSKNKVKTNEPL